MSDNKESASPACSGDCDVCEEILGHERRAVELREKYDHPAAPPSEPTAEEDERAFVKWWNGLPLGFSRAFEIKALQSWNAALRYERARKGEK